MTDSPIIGWDSGDFTWSSISPLLGTLAVGTYFDFVYNNPNGVPNPNGQFDRKPTNLTTWNDAFLALLQPLGYRIWTEHDTARSWPKKDQRQLIESWIKKVISASLDGTSKLFPQFETMVDRTLMTGRHAGADQHWAKKMKATLGIRLLGAATHQIEQPSFHQLAPGVQSAFRSIRMEMIRLIPNWFSAVGAITDQTLDRLIPNWRTNFPTETNKNQTLDIVLPRCSSNHLLAITNILLPVYIILDQDETTRTWKYTIDGAHFPDDLERDIKRTFSSDLIENVLILALDGSLKTARNGSRTAINAILEKMAVELKVTVETAPHFLITKSRPKPEHLILQSNDGAIQIVKANRA